MFTLLFLLGCGDTEQTPTDPSPVTEAPTPDDTDDSSAASPLPGVNEIAVVAGGGGATRPFYGRIAVGKPISTQSTNRSH